MKYIIFLDSFKNDLKKIAKEDSLSLEEYIDKIEVYEEKSSYLVVVDGSKLALRVCESNQDLFSVLLKKYDQGFVTVSFDLKTNFNKKNIDQKNEIGDGKKNNKNLSSSLTFDSFVVGKSNKNGYNASKRVVENLGNSVFNPLFIYGDSGNGKTHLLTAIYNEITKTKPECKVYSINSEDFSQEVVSVLMQNNFKEIEKFKNDLRGYDVLIIDDVQFLANKDKTNEFLFSIYNFFIENNKQIVFSSDKIPENLNGLDKRMITRFNMGLVIALDKPDYETCAAIFKSFLKLDIYKSKNLDKIITEDAIDYIVKYYVDDVRKIKGLVNLIDFHISMEPTNKITVNDAVEMLKNNQSTNIGELTVKKIKDVVGEKYGISVTAIDGVARSKDIIAARHLAMYLVKVIMEHPYKKIGVEFGGKDHTTVMSGVEKIEKLINSDKIFKNDVEKMKNKILMK